MEPLVSISCITYNHAPYIKQCLDGFLMQKTTFSFEVLIHDDASTDGTTEIIKDYAQKYPDIIKPLYEEENQWIKGRRGSAEFNFPRARGKYIALCEGDDYWIDENKLQMQVDFLENNPEYGMCYTKARQYNQKEMFFYKKSFGSGFVGFEDLLKNGNRIPTLTTVYRKDLLDRYQKEIQPNNKGWLMGDYPMWLYFSHESKIKFIEVVTSVYRVLENSASHSVDLEKQFDFKKNVYEIRRFFSDLYSVDYIACSNDEIYFYVYLQELKRQYGKHNANLLRYYYKKSSVKNVKNFIFYLCSFFYWSWSILNFCRKTFP
jgi:glycosyltransferase involved in cell wall biosynthesis